jgi:hypothetical protein
MAAQRLEQVGRPCVDNDVRVGNVDTEAVGEEVFSVLGAGMSVQLWSERLASWERTLPSMVLSSREMFFSLASDRGTSIASVNWLPSLSTKRALKLPSSPSTMAATSACACVFSRRSRFCRFDGGGRTVDILLCVGRAESTRYVRV